MLKLTRHYLEHSYELPNGIPSQDTFERVFQKVSPKYLAVAFKSWADDINELVRERGSRVAISIDGKAIRGSKRASSKAIHVVTALASKLRLTLGEVAVDKKSNEITAIPELLEMFCQKGMVITIDAMGTQKDIVRKIIDKKADYVLAVKRNQETLHNVIFQVGIAQAKLAVVAFCNHKRQLMPKKTIKQQSGNQRHRRICQRVS